MLQRSSESSHATLDQPVAATPGPGTQPTVDLVQLVRILRRRWKAIAAITLSLVAIAVV